MRRGIGKVSDISGASGELALPAGMKEKQLAKKTREASEKRQEEIDEYNKNIGEIDEVFSTRKLLGPYAIIRLRQQDYIKTDTGSIFTDGVQEYNKVPLMTENGNPIYVDNPLPYLFEGIICSLGTTATEAVPDLEVGQYVQLDFVPLQEERHYPDKSKVDVIGNAGLDALADGGTLFPNFEGYFKIHVSKIESILNGSKGNS